MDVLRMLMHYAAVQQKKLKDVQEVSNLKRKTLLKDDDVNSFIATPATISQIASTLPNVSPLLATATQSPAVASTSQSSSATTSPTNDGPKRLHVTNLPFKVRDNELKNMFAAYGTVLDAEIIYNERGSKGFGFVTMETSEDATKAKEALHGTEIDGRKIEVNKATPRSNTLKPTTKLRNKSPVVAATVSAAIVPPTAAANINVMRPVPIPQATAAFQAPWNPASLSTLTSSHVTGFQLPASPPQQFLNSISNTMQTPNPMFPSFSFYPTPEQYAQYYNYITGGATTTQINGPMRAGNNTASSFRFQPY